LIIGNTLLEEGPVLKTQIAIELYKARISGSDDNIDEMMNKMKCLSKEQSQSICMRLFQDI
jgi:hypothetical protein